jgi:hypothetical protein
MGFRISASNSVTTVLETASHSTACRSGFVETIRNQSLIRKPVVAGSRAYQITQISVTNERANNLCALCQRDSFSVRVSADLL